MVRKTRVFATDCACCCKYAVLARLTMNGYAAMKAVLHKYAKNRVVMGRAEDGVLYGLCRMFYVYV